MASSSSSSRTPAVATNDFGASTGGPAVIGEKIMPKDELALKKEKEAKEQASGAGDDDEEDVQVPSSPDGIIDMDILGQVFEMDEVEDDDDEEGGGHEFSKGIVFNYFEQANTTFDDMRAALAKKDLPSLSSLGHFLKGSSAALGVIKVKDSCEKMQHYGNCRDEEAGTDMSEDEALSRIAALLKVVEHEYKEAASWLRNYYEEKEAEQ